MAATAVAAPTAPTVARNGSRPCPDRRRRRCIVEGAGMEGGAEIGKGTGRDGNKEGAKKAG
ncbi:hypothetical protein GCM10007242_31430 [Pigmentiphaga litoralis]|nr:hypothetical protein GCM10007242_31430 [Pigmentiphaga litoralis]